MGGHGPDIYGGCTTKTRGVCFEVEVESPDHGRMLHDARIQRPKDGTGTAEPTQIT